MQLLASLYIFIAILGSNAFAQTPQTVSLKMATFNLGWYGLGGTFTGSPDKEYRDPYLKEFIEKHLMPADVISFQEVVDTNRLLSILPKGWHCSTYFDNNPTHQYVVICASDSYKFGIVSYDDNNIIETVSGVSSRARPAVRVNLIQKSTNTILATLVGVHLKAYPYESDKRLVQMKALSEDLVQNDPLIPIVLMGDFNSYTKTKTNQKKDDVTLFQDILNQNLKTVKYVKLKDTDLTYRKKSLSAQFDQFFVRGAAKVKKPQVFSVCGTPNGGTDYFDINFYNKNISDHCPVSLEVLITK